MMIDIHSHILPCLDDVAATLNDSLELCQFAVDNGITHMLTTPHIHPGRYDNDKAMIEESLQSLKQVLEEHQIPLQLSCAAEVRISVEMMALISEDKIPFVGYYKGFHYLLLEMPHSHILPGSQKLISWLNERKIKAIIAHPERNKEVQHDISKLSEFVKQGCLLQLTAASISGSFGKICQDVSRQLIENRWVSFVASDAHNIKNRPPDMKQGFDYLTQWIGEERAYKMCHKNQQLMTAMHFSKQ